MAIDIDEARLRRSEPSLWLAWTLATAAGMLAGFVPFTFFIADLDVLLFRILLPLAAGLLVGLFQWLALRPWLAQSADWVLSDGAGWSLGFALGLVLIQAMGRSPLGALLAYLLFGLIIGIFQWPLLRREIPSAVPWVLASVLGWAGGALLGQAMLNLVAPAGDISQALSTAIVAGVTGLTAGAITGLALVWIARQPDRAAAPRPTAERPQ
jgi:hypothetical protein